MRLASIVTSRPERVQGLRGVQVVPTVAELLAHPQVELVVVASPSASHFEVARAALLAHKHVVVDKPFALTVAEADELIEIAKRNGCVLSVFQNRRWDGDYLTVRGCIEEGWLGAIRYYEARYDRFRPQVRPVWREQAGAGSGILYDLGAHLIDQALQLFGLPQTVTADLLSQREGAQAVDYFHLQLHYEPLRAVLHGSMLAAGPGPHFTVHGEGGSFLKYGMDPQEEQLKAGGKPGMAHWGADAPENYGRLFLADGSNRTVATMPGCYEQFYTALTGALRRGTPPPVLAAEARDGLLVIEAAMESAARQRTVALT